jgi:hypothetical protein
MVAAYSLGEITPVLQTATQQLYQTYRQELFGLWFRYRKLRYFIFRYLERLMMCGDVWPGI